jgi:uncharacterized protein YegJ (DUF2314 family)
MLFAALAGLLLTAPPLLYRDAQMPVAFVPVQKPLTPADAKNAFAAVKGVDVQVESVAREDYPGLGADSLDNTGFQLSPDEIAAVKKTKQAVSVKLGWTAADGAKLRELYERIADLAASTGAVIFDRHAATAFTAAQWRQRRIESGFKGGIASGQFHFQVHMVLQDNGLVMLDTGGLLRFGVNDLTVLNVNRSSVKAVGNVVNAVAQRLIEGARPDGKGRLLVSLDDIRSDEMRAQLTSNVFPNGKKKLVVGFTASDDSLGARPEALELTFPTLGCKDRGECIDAATTALFGAGEDKVQTITPDAAVEAARRRALEALKTYESKLKAGLPAEESLLVKARFPYPGGREWMWIDVQSWSGTTLTGHLQTEPAYVVGLKPGATVSKNLDDVMDYVYKFKDGTFVGQEVGRLLHPEMFAAAGNGRWRYKE